MCGGQNSVIEEELSLMIYHLREQISFKTRSSCMHYIMSNLLFQFTQFIHYPLLPLVFYHFIVFYIRACIYMSILTASLSILLFAYPVATFCDCNT